MGWSDKNAKYFPFFFDLQLWVKKIDINLENKFLDFCQSLKKTN